MDFESESGEGVGLWFRVAALAFTTSASVAECSRPETRALIFCVKLRDQIIASSVSQYVISQIMAYHILR